MLTTLRDVRGQDLDAVLELNEQVVPAVNSIPMSKMCWFVEHAAYFRVATVDDRLGAFLIGLRPGTDYESSFYQWFCRRFDDFGYIDRVAVAEDARRLGLAGQLYEDFQQSLPSDVVRMTCEVNTRPPNEVSMRFHERLSFRQIGSLDSDDGQKTVATLEKRI